jgi:hypothetical protein
MDRMRIKQVYPQTKTSKSDMCPVFSSIRKGRQNEEQLTIFVFLQNVSGLDKGVWSAISVN